MNEAIYPVPGLKLQVLGAESVLFDARAQRYIGLDTVQTLIWQELRAGDGKDAMLARCAAVLKARGLPSSGLQAAFDHLLAEGLLMLAHEGRVDAR